MSKAYRFHADVHGDSITVETRVRLTVTAVEVLVNGKVVAVDEIKGAGMRELTASLPSSPQGRVRIQVRQPGHHAAPECAVSVDDILVPMQVAMVSG